MSLNRLFGMMTLAFALTLTAGAPAGAQVLVQCPGDLNGDSIPDPYEFRGNGQPNPNRPNPTYDPNVTCIHLTGGDGFGVMADGRVQYLFSFADVTGVGDENGDGDISDDVMAAGTLAHEWPAPPIGGTAYPITQGQKFFLNLTNVGMVIRPDLFDPHTVHFHGFPQSSTVFDGLPESGLSINMGATLTYYYELVDPGTYMYHCHVEATEHMQMGMLGSLYVRPGQNRLSDLTPLNGWTHTNTGDADNPPFGNFPAAEDVDLNGNLQFDEGVYDHYAYNDGDGSTRYDVEYALQLGAFDPEFHDASWFVQPLPFAMMWDRYPMINGRGYPDTIDPNPLPAPAENGGIPSQLVSSLVTATQGQRVLLRLSNLNITVTHNLISPSIPMTVVGIDAKELATTDGLTKLHYTTSSVSMGGGMSVDVILDTTGIASGEYYLYAANLDYLANNDEDSPTGGIMTKIVINP